MRTNNQPGFSIATAGKLEELRAKTDRDLAFLLRRASDRALWLVQQNDFENAEALYARASTFLPLLQAVAPQEMTSLRNKLSDLRYQLDEAACADTRLAS